MQLLLTWKNTHTYLFSYNGQITKYIASSYGEKKSEWLLFILVIQNHQAHSDDPLETVFSFYDTFSLFSTFQYR